MTIFETRRKVFAWECELCNKKIETMSENQLNWLSRIHIMTHEKTARAKVE